MIYLDYAANTPVDKDVLKEFVKANNDYIANPNSIHKLGLEAKEKIDECNKEISKVFNIKEDSIIYTSGSSESNNLVIKGVSEYYKDLGKHIIISSLEHSSIVAPVNYLVNNGFDVSVINIKKDGKIDLDELKTLIRDDTILVSICYVDSELGTIQPIKEIATILKEYPNIIFHTDATQAVGKINVDFSGVDFVSFAPHKFYGLNGIGYLLNINNKKIIPQIHGGKSTTIYRSGTPDKANIIAGAKSIKLAMDNLSDRYEYITGLKNYLKEELSIFKNVHINSPKESVPNILNISLRGMDSKEFVKKLNDNNIFVSTTSACSLGNTPSKAVYSITNDLQLAKNSIRISLSHLTKIEDLEKFMNIFKKIYDEELKNEDN